MVARPFSCMEHGVALEPLDGALNAIGPRYRARFTDSGFEFTPKLGATPRSTHLRFALAEVRRGSSTVAVVGNAPPVPSYAESRVEYDRGVCIERYDLGDDGVEQSFVFDRLPPGAGDLIVRGRFECDLPAAAVANGLAFDRAGVGGFRIGKITGIAGDGTRADGSMRVVGDVIEFSLPGAFVADAPLPLTLDPLIGSVFTVDVPPVTWTNVAPRIAYDLATDTYLVVWLEVEPGSTPTLNVVGRLLSSSGAILGLFATAIGADQLTVANIAARHAFLITYHQDNRVWAQAIGTTVVGNLLTRSNPVLVGGGITIDHGGEIGGESDPNDDTGLCVWKSDGAQATSIKAREVGIDANFNVTLSPVFIVAGNGHDRPKISHTSGAAHRYAIVTSFPTAAGNHDPYVTIVDRHGQPLAAPVPLSTSTKDETDPAVDGDGTTWVAAWTSVFATNDGDVKAKAFAFDPATGSVVFNSGEAIVAADRNDDEKEPSVCWTGGSALVGYQDQAAPGSLLWDAYVKSIDLMHCTACEGYFWLGRNNGINLTPQVACKTPGTRSPEDAMIVWESASTTTFNGTILGQLWTTADGNTVEMAKSCGKGGTCYTACARVGYGSFAFELRDSAPAAPTIFFMSGFTWPVYSCGTCNLIPYGGVQLVLTTDTHGACSVPVALPNDPILRTLSLYTQWVTVNTVDPACPQLRLDMSNALKVTLE